MTRSIRLPYIPLVNENQEPDAEVISAVFSAMVNRRWARKTKAEKLAIGRALTATRMAKQGKVRAKSAKKSKRK